MSVSKSAFDSRLAAAEIFTGYIALEIPIHMIAVKTNANILFKILLFIIPPL